MSMFVAGLLYDGAAEPDEWVENAAAGPATGGRIRVELVAPRTGVCRMVARPADGDSIAWRGNPVAVFNGAVVWQDFAWGDAAGEDVAVDQALANAHLSGVDVDSPEWRTVLLLVARDLVSADDAVDAYRDVISGEGS